MSADPTQASGGEPLIRWDWVASHSGDIAARLWEHSVLTVTAVAVGFIIAFALSALILRFPRLNPPVTWVTGVLYTVPSLALFAMLIPITGLSVLTAEIGLVGYTLLILIRNIVGGIRSVPSDVVEAAAGMGCTNTEIFWKVELPLALPVILGGVRVAVITTVGLTTVTALIGQGGLGFYILEGIQRFFPTPLVVGATLSVVLAVFADGALAQLQRWLTPWVAAR